MVMVKRCFLNLPVDKGMDETVANYLDRFYGGVSLL